MSDLISRQDAITSFRLDDDGEAWSMEDIIYRLEQFPSAQPELRWIPCSERLPDKNGRYLCTNSIWGAYEVDWNAWINGEWLYPNEKPIAWMSLPEPWKGEQDG